MIKHVMQPETAPTAVEGAPVFEVWKYFSPHHRKSNVSGAAIASLDACFADMLLPRRERRVYPAWIIGYTLNTPLFDSTIIAALGREWCDMHLVHLWQLLFRQRDGKEGVLFTDGSPNIIFVAEAGALYQVGAWFTPQWQTWSLDARQVTKSSFRKFTKPAQNTTCRVISRCSFAFAQMHTFEPTLADRS